MNGETVLAKCRHKETIDHLKLQVDALAFIKQQGLKLTAPRKAIVHLLAHEQGPFTIETLQKRVMECEGVSMDPATVYRTMVSLEQLGVVNRCDFGDGPARFELRRPHHHHHMICRVCRHVSTLDSCTIDEAAFLPLDHGFRDVTHRLEFFGTCPRCSKKAVKETQ